MDGDEREEFENPLAEFVAEAAELMPEGGVSPFFASSAVVSEPLTREAWDEMVEKVKEHDREIRMRPVGPCGCHATLVSPAAYERLRREGGWAVCASCMWPFHIDPPPKRPEPCEGRSRT
jgi:hypothetical protein